MITHTVQINVIGELQSKRARNFSLQSALLELIDNSVDESANEITIREHEGDLFIEDNGNGFTSIPRALIIAESTKQGKIGRYGVGMKDACLKYSNCTIIESNGKRVVAPWLKMIEDGKTDLVEENDIEHTPITRIKLCQFRKRYAKQIETKDIIRTYQKLIEAGKVVISVVGTKLQKLELPKFTDIVEQEFTYDGRNVALSGGIYACDDPARHDWKGYNAYYNGRLIGNGKIMNRGVGDEGCINFCFTLELSDAGESWALSTNKDEVEDIEGLLDYIYHNYTRDILKKGAEQTIDVELKNTEDRINTKLNGDNPSGNITRSPRTERNERKKESGKGSPKMRTYTANRDGDYNNGNGSDKRHSLKFRFAKLEDSRLGEVNESGKRTLVVTANLNNQHVARNKTNEDFGVMFAKFCYAIHKSAVNELNGEMFADGMMKAIMELAGSELDS